MIPGKYHDEVGRLAALRRYGILDTPAEPVFDEIARLAAHICGTPVAVVNFVDSGRQWFKAEIGLGVRETPLDTSICAHAMLQKGLFVVPDTLLDARFAENPLCCSDPHLRFYAGALLETQDGFPLGTLCVLDYVPRELTESQKDSLSILSRQVMTQLDLSLNLKELAASEAFAQAVLDSSPDCVEVLDLEGRIVRMNAEGCRRMDANGPGVWLEHLWLDRWTGAERDAALKAFHTARAGGKSEFSGYGRTFQESAKYWEVAVAPIASADGKTEHVIVRSRDITSRHRAEEQLRDAAKLESLAVMAGGMAHDFNNLLTGILGFASLLADFVPPSERYMTDHIVQAAGRAADLTGQMLAYSGKGSFEMRPVDLSSEVREVLRMLDPMLDRGVAVSLRLDGDLPRIQGDKSQMRQMIGNLIVNAFEAMKGKPGQLTITTSAFQAAPHVCLEIRDTGCGMDEQTKARMFDPFFTTKFTGRGLGLAAVSGIVRGHHGTLAVESEPGKGTTFRLSFPAMAAAYAEIPLGLRGNESPRAGTILIVDDEEMVRNVGSTALKRAGYDVRLASDGQEAVDLFAAEAHAISLIVLDVTMPGMNGDAALRLIRELRREVPVILSSGYTESEVIRRFECAEIDGFLQKPYSASALAAKVSSILAGRSQAASAS